MTKQSKEKILAAFDALALVANARPHKGSRAIYLTCDICHGADRHAPECPINVSMKALMPILPSFEGREAWLLEPEQ